MKLRSKFAVFALTSFIASVVFCIQVREQFESVMRASFSLDRNRALSVEVSGMAFQLLCLVDAYVKRKLSGSGSLTVPERNDLANFEQRVVQLDAMQFNLSKYQRDLLVTFDGNCLVLFKVLREDRGYLSSYADINQPQNSDVSIEIISRSRKLQHIVNRCVLSANQLLESLNNDSGRLNAQLQFARQEFDTLLSTRLPILALVLFSLSWLFSGSLISKFRRISRNLELYAAGEKLLPQIKSGDEVEALDVSIRKLINAISESREKEKLLIENSPEVIILLNGKNVIVEVSEACRTRWNLAKEDLVGCRILSFVSDGSKELFGKCLETVRESKERVQFVCEMNMGELYSFTADWTFVAVSSSDAICGIATDISEKMALERMKQRLISTVTHELRTPLSSIKAFFQMALSGTFGALSPDLVSSSNLLNQSTDRLLALINELLDLEKFSASNLRLEMRVCFVSEIFKEVEAAVGFSAKQKHINIAFESAVASITCDFSKLVQVLVNLVGNAIKYGPANSAVLVTVGSRQGQVEFKVLDRGKSIPKHEQERLFDAFYRAVGSSNINNQGSGLGLWIAREIVRSHGGLIGLDSSHSGNEFWFTIPSFSKSEV